MVAGLIRILSLLSCSLLFTFLLPGTGNAQAREERISSQRTPHEFPDDPYVRRLSPHGQTSPAYSFFRNGFSIVQVNVDTNGMNIVGDAANEPSIAVHPTDPDKLAIGWRQFDTIDSNFRQAGYGYTTDGGFSWRFPGVLDPGVFRSDPVLDSDTQGGFLYYSLATDPDYHCTLFKDSDGGASWDDGVYAYGGDKAWMAIDRTNGIGRDQVYFAWDFAGCCGDDWFTRSTDRGVTFDLPVPIPHDPIWGVTAVAPDGAVYIAGTGSSSSAEFVVAKSSVVQDPDSLLLFDFAVEVDMGGRYESFLGTGPNPGGLQGQTWIAGDYSSGPNAGNLYMLCSVDPPGSDPLDVHFVRSTDGGSTWSNPVRINDDSSTTAWQWFGTLSVSPEGRIDVIWLDTRKGPGVFSALYYSYSTDGGTTWSANEQLSDSFDPHLGWPNQDKLGDYFDMVSLEEGMHLAWAATFNGEQDVYYSWIPAHVTEIADDDQQVPHRFALSQNYPNPFNPSTDIGYRIAENGHVTLKIFDILGREITTLVDEKQDAGYREARWNAAGQPSGVYFYRLQAGSYVETKKLILLR